MQVTVTFDPTLKAVSAADIAKVLRKQADALMSGPAADAEEDEDDAPAKKTGKKTKPAKTVSDDEDEDFGSEAVDEDELEEDADAEESEDEDEDALSWETVKAAINQYGNKKPDEMKAILLSFNFKSTKELHQVKKKWEPIYRKVMAKLKATKKAK